MEKVGKINKKKCTSSFQAVSRDGRNFAFRNKTGAPEVGKYNPMTRAVEANVPKAHLNSK